MVEGSGLGCTYALVVGVPTSLLFLLSQECTCQGGLDCSSPSPRDVWRMETRHFFWWWGMGTQHTFPCVVVGTTNVCATGSGSAQGGGVCDGGKPHLSMFCWLVSGRTSGSTQANQHVSYVCGRERRAGVPRQGAEDTLTWRWIYLWWMLCVSVCTRSWGWTSVRASLPPFQ